jgi:DNA-binding CsgD family transcriptional regulator
MDPASNPYRPGAGTRPPVLSGRDEFVDQFGAMMRLAMDGRPGKSVMPTGLRGVGKTVLLSQFRDIATHEGMEVAFIEAPEDGSFVQKLAIRLRSVLYSMQRNAPKEAISRALGVLKAFSYQLPDGTTIRIDVDAITGVADSGDLAEDLSDLLLAVGKAAAAKDTGLLLAIDEVQYLGQDELSAVITAVHRVVQEDLPVVVVGAGLPQLPGLTGNAKSYSERLFAFPEIGSLSQEDANAALEIPASEQGVRFTSEALAKVYEVTRGYPYFIQEWGHHLWLHCDGPDITAEDVDRVRPMVEDTLDANFFRVRLDRLTPKEREYLRAMAELGPGPHRSGEIAAMLGVKVESVAPRRSMLINKGMVYSPAHGDTGFTVPLFDQFLRRVLPWPPE